MELLLLHQNDHEYGWYKITRSGSQSILSLRCCPSIFQRQTNWTMISSSYPLFSKRSMRFQSIRASCTLVLQVSEQCLMPSNRPPAKPSLRQCWLPKSGRVRFHPSGVPCGPPHKGISTNQFCLAPAMVISVSIGISGSAGPLAAVSKISYSSCTFFQRSTLEPPIRQTVWPQYR